jgi:hypothetical protein
MKAWELQDRGFDNLRLVERPTPRPGPHDLLVRVSAVSLNHRDEDIILGWLGAIGQDPLDESMRARRRRGKLDPGSTPPLTVPGREPQRAPQSPGGEYRRCW